MNYNEYFGKGNQNAGWGTSGTPATENENWDNYFDGQSVHVPIQKIYADSPQVSTPTVPNQGRSYMDVTPQVTERPSHELMLKELQQREQAHRMAQQQKDYYRTWNQKIRQMEQESEGIADGGIVAQAAPGSTETGRLSDYFDMEPGDFVPENVGGRPLNIHHSHAKKVVFTEDGPVYADELSKKSTKNATKQESENTVGQQFESNATLTAGQQDVIVGDPIPVDELQLTSEENSVSLRNEINDALQTTDENPDEAGFMIPNFDDVDIEKDVETEYDVFERNDFEDDVEQEADIADDVIESEIFEDEAEPVREIVTGETEVDSIEEIEETVETEPEIDEPASVDEMLGGIDISDLPDDIPMNIDEEYAREHEQKRVQKKKTATTSRKKSDKTVKTKKKTTTSKKATAKKK